jgi:hypothetical protein
MAHPKSGTEQLFFCHPAQLKTGQSSYQHWNVDVALMVDHKEVGLPAIESAGASHFDGDSAEGENRPCPQPPNPIHMLSLRIEKAQQDSRKRGRHGYSDEQRQLQEVEHEGRCSRKALKTRIYSS